MIKKVLIFTLLLFIGLATMWGQDITPPAPVTIRYVDVNPGTGSVNISWNPSSSVDVEGYEIFKLINGYYIKIGDVAHPVTSFINAIAIPPSTNSSLANSQVETYRVTAYDGVVPTPNFSELCAPHHTVYLELNFMPCFGEIQLAWNQYDTWLTGVYSYNIWCKINSGAWQIVSTIPGEYSSFAHSNIEADKDYYYYVEANDGAGSYSARSNKVGIYTDMPVPPAVLNANYASVAADDYIDLSFTIDLSADVTFYQIQRTDSLGEEFQILNSIDASTLSSNIIKYTDNAPTDIVHYYKMIAINTCNVPFLKTSNIASNIVLEVDAQNDLRNSLIWTNYYKWDIGISYFEVIRTIDFTSSVIIAEIPYGDTTHLDKIDNYLYDPNYNPLNPIGEILFPNTYLEQPTLSGQFCYQIRAYEGIGATLGNYASLSNTVCVSPTPRVFIPNAFSPNYDGQNDLFYPFLSFAGLNHYDLRIVDRWGALVFHTRYPHEGWDGKQRNRDEIAPVGTYIYYLTFTDGNGEEHKYQGSVLLIR